MGGIISAIINFVFNFSFVVVALFLLLFFGWNFWTGLFFILAILACIGF